MLMLAGVLGQDRVVVAATPSVYAEPTANLTPVYLPNVEYRDHRGLRGEDLVAYEATRARLQAEIKRLEKLQSVPVYKAQLSMARRDLERLDQGTFPFARFKNILDGSDWGKYWNRSAAVIVIKPVPPPERSWIEVVVKKIGDALVWVKDKIAGFLSQYVCPYLKDPRVQAAMGYALKAGTTALVGLISPYVGGPVVAKIIVGLVVGMGVKSLYDHCGLTAPLPQATPLPTAPPSSPTSRPPPVTPSGPKFPAGTMARFNLDTGLWSYYVPKGLSGASLTLTKEQGRDLKLGIAALLIIGVTVGGITASALSGALGG